MMEKYSKHSNILLLLGSWVIMLGIISIHQLFSLPAAYQKHQQSSEQLRLIEHADQIILDLTQQAKQLEEILGNFTSREIPMAKHMDFVTYLEELSREQQTRIIALPREEQLQTQGFQVSKVRFSLESDIHKLLSVLHSLEWQDRAGSISYLDLVKRHIQTGNSRRHILVADVELQRLIQP